MRWIAALYLFGFHPSCLDKRVTVEAGPTFTTAVKKQSELCMYWGWGYGFGGWGWRWKYGNRSVLRGDTCNAVHEIYERRDGARYVKEHTDCVPYYEMKGSCS